MAKRRKEKARTSKVDKDEQRYAEEAQAFEQLGLERLRQLEREVTLVQNTRYTFDPNVRVKAAAEELAKFLQDLSNKHNVVMTGSLTVGQMARSQQVNKNARANAVLNIAEEEYSTRHTYLVYLSYTNNH